MKGKIVRATRTVARQSCDYSVLRRRSGFEIIVDCGDCGAEPGLDNPVCFGNIARAVQQEGSPVAITLRSHVERRYGAGATATIGQISSILNRVQSLQGQLAMDSARGGGCPECVRILTGKLAVIGQGFASMEISGALSAAKTLETKTPPARQICQECAGMTNVQIQDIRVAVRNLENSILRDAFNVVAVDG